MTRTDQYSSRARLFFIGGAMIFGAALVAITYLAFTSNQTRGLDRRIEGAGGFVAYHFHGPALMRHLLGDVSPFKTPMEVSMGPGTTDADLRLLIPLRSAKVVTLSGTRVKGPGLTYLTNLAGIQILDLTKSAVGNDGLRYVTNLTTLRTLLLAQLDVGDEGITNLQYLPHLEKLNLELTQVTDDGLMCLLNLPLKQLSLRATKVTDNGVYLISNTIHNLELTR